MILNETRLCKYVFKNKQEISYFLCVMLLNSGRIFEKSGVYMIGLSIA